MYFFNFNLDVDTTKKFRMISLLLPLLLVAHVADSSKDLPSGMDQHQYCHGCMATMKELVRKLPQNLKGSRDLAVIDALEKICIPANFVSYHYSPPKTVKVCKLVLENNEDEIETILKKKEDVDAVTHICTDVTGACVGIDLTKDDKEAKFSDIDLTKGGGSVQIDPSSGNVVKEDKNDGKTLTKPSKKKKSKKSKRSTKGETEKSKKTSSEPAKEGGQKKGAIHNLNIDINDPDSLKRVMEQINKISGQYNNPDEKKDEL